MSITSHDEQEKKWFSEEVQPHEPALRAFLRARFWTIADIDDLVQESYRHLIRARISGRVADVRSYLFKTAKNIAIDLFRRTNASAVDSSADVDVSSVMDIRPDAAEAASSAQELELLQDGLNALPERCRKIMILRKLHGLSNQAIAGQLGVSVHTVNAQLVTGVMRCRKYLQERGVIRRELGR